MTALIVLGCILLFFIFLLSIKFKIIVSYSDEVALCVRVLGLKNVRLLAAEGEVVVAVGSVLIRDGYALDGYECGLLCN